MISASDINFHLARTSGLPDGQRAKLAIGSAAYAGPGRSVESEVEKRERSRRENQAYQESCRRAWAGGGG